MFCIIRYKDGSGWHDYVENSKILKFSSEDLANEKSQKIAQDHPDWKVRVLIYL